MLKSDEADFDFESDDLPTPEAIEDSYLINRHVKGERRYKLHLRRTDHETLTALLDDKPLPMNPSERITENFAFFEDEMKEVDSFLVYRGLRKLIAIDVHLSRGQDDPQMIFESLNSTGLDLTQADLIRNFVLMRQNEGEQTRLYENYWRPIEVAFGAKYGDLPFDKKKTLVDKEGRQVGLDFSPLRLNRFIREQKAWTQEQIEERGMQLANRAIKIWPPLSVEMSVVRTAELEELKANAQRFKIDDLEFGPETRALFDELRKQVCALGADIIELPGPNTVTYRVFDFFVEVIPRRRYLTLNLNLDFEEADDPTERAIDATERAFIVHATETGGVLFRVRETKHIAPAMHLVRQAYENASE
jgi:predicted transport protein